MPILHIEFDTTGGTLFEIRYRRIGGSTWSTTNTTTSPVDINIPTQDPYEYCIKKVCTPDNKSIEICGTAQYIAPCPTPTFAFDSKTGNSFTFTYLLALNQLMFDVEITPPLGVTPYIQRYVTDDNDSPWTLSVQSLTAGIWRFRMRGVCGVDANSAVSNWTGYVDVDVALSPCEAPLEIVNGAGVVNTTSSLSFSRTSAQANSQSNAPESFTEAMIYSSYTGDFDYKDIKIISLPSQGSISVHGWDVVVPYICPILEIQDGNFEFWPKKSDMSGAFVDYTTTFQYMIYDIYGNEVNLVTMTVNFNAI